MSTTPRRGIPLSETPWGHVRGQDRYLWVIVDTLAILALLTLVALAFWPVYGTPWLFVTVLGFGVVGAAVAVVAAVRSWPAGLTALALVGAWFLVGTPLVMPSAGIGWVIPSGRSLWGLLTGPVTAWRDMLTLEPPIGETVNLLAVPGIIALLSAAAAVLVSLRTRAPAAAWVPLAVGWVLAAALGAQVAYRPLWVGVAFFLIVLLWTTYRRSHVRTALTSSRAQIKPGRVAFGALTLVVAIVAAYFVAPHLEIGTPRHTVRQAVEPPIDLEQFASPLQGFRANVTQRHDEVMLQAQGLREGEVLRIATLDKYDGMSFQVSSTDDQALAETTFTRVGQWIADPTPGIERSVLISVRGFDDVWVPTMGKSTSFAFEGERRIAISESFFYNRGSGTGLSTAGIRDGDAYELSFIHTDRPADVEIETARPGDAQLPAVEGVPDALRNLSMQWTDGLASAGQKALALEAQLRQGYFSHGGPDEVRSLSGHSQARLSTLLQTPDRMVGDDEQFATAMVLMARDLGIPARVIYGYRGNGTGTVFGRDVAAWAELQFDELGWVVFDPTPPKDRILQDEDPPQAPTPRPHIENPPPPPQLPETPPQEEDMPIQPVDPPEQTIPIDWAEIGRLAAIFGVPLVTVVLPVALILGVKLRRRSRRRNNPILANRLAGAWAEVVDRARDLGRSPSFAATRTEQAEELMGYFDKLAVKVNPIEVSREADRVVFAPDDPAESVATDYWQASGEVNRGMRRSVSAPRWLLSWLSTRSFRKPGVG